MKNYLVLAIAASLFAVPAWAQEGAQKIATCNALKVLEGMQERRAYEAELQKKITKWDTDKRRRDADLAQLVRERDDLNPDSVLWQEKNNEYIKVGIETEVTLRAQQLELMRWQKTRLKQMYERIREATKEVATQKGIDLVLAERRSELQAMDALTVDQVKAIIAQNDVIFSGAKVDITQDVLIAVDKKYTAPGGAAPK